MNCPSEIPKLDYVDVSLYMRKPSEIPKLSYVDVALYMRRDNQLIDPYLLCIRWCICCLDLQLVKKLRTCFDAQEHARK